MITHIGHYMSQSDRVNNSLIPQFYTQSPELHCEATAAQRVGTHLTVDRKSIDLISEPRNRAWGNTLLRVPPEKRENKGYRVYGIHSLL